MLKLDLIDRKILHELDKNSRTPASQIARRLRQSRELVNYRISNLENGGIIRKYVTMINPAKLGYSIFKLYFKFQNISSDMEKQAIKWLIDNKFVYWVASAKGKWDINITIFARNITHFEEITSEFVAKYGKYIAEQEFNTTLEVNIMSKDWILPEQKNHSTLSIVGGENADIKLDSTDVEILKVLANNARMSAMELAKRTKSTQKIVIYRMKQLEKTGVILGYSVSLNLEFLDMQFFKSVVYFNFLSAQTKAKIIEACRNNPHIGFLIFCVGRWPLELEIVVKDNKEYYDVMDKFRDLFPDMKGYETIIFPTEYKFDWMPLCYIAQK